MTISLCSLVVVTISLCLFFGCCDNLSLFFACCDNFSLFFGCCDNFSLFFGCCDNFSVLVLWLLSHVLCVFQLNVVTRSRCLLNGVRDTLFVFSC